MDVRLPNQCEHERTEIRKKLDSAGRATFRAQCLDCGYAKGGCIAQKNVPNIWCVRAFDVELERAGEEAQQRWWRDFQANRTQTAQQEEAERWAKYTAYLNTPKWKAKSRAVVARDKICQACLTRAATEAHHLNYFHIYNEPLFDLVGVCHECHKKITEMDRARRAG